jgi:ABC-type amino acid transport substrate-binding protein
VKAAPDKDSTWAKHEWDYPADTAGYCPPLNGNMAGSPSNFDHWIEPGSYDCTKVDGKPHKFKLGDAGYNHFYNSSSWCTQASCYVDPCTCDKQDIQVSSWFKTKTGPDGGPIYYSGQVCGGAFTFKAALCAGQTDQASCEKDKGCVWKGTAGTTTNPPTKAPVGGVMKLKFGQDVNYPPYAYKDANTGKLAGFGKDIADGLTAMCSDLEIEVVEEKWSNCWSSSGGGTLGAKVDDGTIDACMTYTHTQGIRNKYADFSYGILKVNKAAGLISKLVNGKPLVTGLDDLKGKTVVDVGGWAPTADGLGFVTNQCNGKKYSSDYTLLVGDGNDAALTLLLNGTADAMFVYADQAYNYKCKAGVKATYNCTMWEGLGKTFAYVQTGQFGYVVNGTTLALSRKGSGVPAMVNPCLAKFMATKEYYDVCKKYKFEGSCYPNKFFPNAGKTVKIFDKKTMNHDHADCSGGYCPCPKSTSTSASAATSTSATTGSTSSSGGAGRRRGQYSASETSAGRPFGPQSKVHAFALAFLAVPVLGSL